MPTVPGPYILNFTTYDYCFPLAASSEQTLTVNVSCGAAPANPWVSIAQSDGSGAFNPYSFMVITHTVRTPHKNTNTHTHTHTHSRAHTRAHKHAQAHTTHTPRTAGDVFVSVVGAIHVLAPACAVVTCL
jgi:hypothetical protein